MIGRGAGGAIINIISTAGHQGEPGNIAYCTAKCGLINFTRSAAMELVGHGIRVNSLTPTATDPLRIVSTGRSVGAAPSPARRACAARMEAFRSRVPMQQLPSQATTATPRCFSLRMSAAMITGTDLRVDAGAVARYWAWDPG